MMGLLKLILYLAAFGVLSYGSALIVNTIGTFTRRLRVPPFIFSFFIVGLITSVAEIAVAVNAVSVGRPEIFVGSMLGGTLVIFLLVIPLMTLLSGGLPVKRHISGRKLLTVLAIFAAPAFVTLDRVVTTNEALVLIGLYVSMFFLLRKSSDPPPAPKTAKLKNVDEGLVHHAVLKLILGTALVFLSSRFIVEQTLDYAEALNLSAFLISLIVIAIGTNLPEFALAIKAAQSHELKAMDIAVGDFLGSAGANVLFFGVFTLINNGDVITAKNFVPTFLCTLLALIGFFAFTRGKSILTIKEARVLLALYLLFVITQFAQI